MQRVAPVSIARIFLAERSPVERAEGPKLHFCDCCPPRLLHSLLGNQTDQKTTKISVCKPNEKLFHLLASSLYIFLPSRKQPLQCMNTSQKTGSKNINIVRKTSFPQLRSLKYGNHLRGNFPVSFEVYERFYQIYVLTGINLFSFYRESTYQ